MIQVALRHVCCKAFAHIASDCLHGHVPKFIFACLSDCTCVHDDLVLTHAHLPGQTLGDLSALGSVQVTDSERAGVPADLDLTRRHPDAAAQGIRLTHGVLQWVQQSSADAVLREKVRPHIAVLSLSWDLGLQDIRSCYRDLRLSSCTR